MILAGIDEAGYGPLLGPLVVGCCAFEVDADAGVDDPPCLWKRLRKHVSKNRLRGGKKIHVNDSKMVYNPSIGLKELERAILTIFTTWQGDGCDNLTALLEQTAAHVLPDLEPYDWYRSADDERFPLESDGLSIRLFANALKQEMDRQRTSCVYLAARVVPERQLNRMFASTRNKSNALFSIAAIHLDHLVRTFGQQNLTVFCDRQGGREHYGQFLHQIFDDWSMEITAEADGYSEYRLSRDGHMVRIIFAEKAEAQCMSTALASMLSKYLREALMRRFNAYWHSHLPEVAPTAGYYGDGERFLKDIDLKRRELGIRDEELIRSR